MELVRDDQESFFDEVLNAEAKEGLKEGTDRVGQRCWLKKNNLREAVRFDDQDARLTLGKRACGPFAANWKRQKTLGGNFRKASACLCKREDAQGFEND